MDDLRIKNIIKNDGWKNLFTGLGGKADKKTHTKARPDGFLLDEELETIYADDGLGDNIIDFLPEDMMKRGWHYNFKNQKEGFEELSNEYDTFFSHISAYDKLTNALKWARLYGGGVLLIGAFDGNELNEPLNIRRIKDFENLKFIPRNNIMYGTIQWQMNPTKERYGLPEIYPLTFRVGRDFIVKEVHWTRVIELHGIEIPTSQSSLIPPDYRYWGLSELQRVQDKLKDVAGAFGSLSNMLHELSIGKYKFRDLADILAAPEGDKLIQKRLQSMDLMKSTFHSLIMDTDEDYIRDSASFAGVPEVMYQFFMLICSASSYPMTRLFGISPGGLNSTGDGDTYRYYDKVESEQKRKLLPILDRLTYIYSEWKNIEKPIIEFNPLEQMTEKEQAEIDEKKANTEKIKMDTYQGYIDMGIMTPEIVEELEFGNSLKEIESKINGSERKSELPSVGDSE
jgi:phage-related protein (TIGR01555 family)